MRRTFDVGTFLLALAQGVRLSSGILGAQVSDDENHMTAYTNGAARGREISKVGSSLIGVETTARLQTWRSAFKEDPELFKGCSKIFMDVGSNRGTHIRKLFEPEKYPQAEYLKIFDSAFGNASMRAQPSNESGICAFGFEANPRWTHDLKAIQAAYAKKGWTARFFVPTAVSDHKGTLNLTMSKADRHNSDWGASVVPDSPSLIVDDNENNKPEDQVTVPVPAMDLSNFVEAMVQNTNPGYRLMKMDIEGAEYTVLPAFMKKDLLCKPKIDQVTIEWHFLQTQGKVETAFCDLASSFAPLGNMLRSLKDHNFLSAKTCTSQELSTRASEVRNKVVDQDKCKPKEATQISEIDDESYLQDGMPLP